MAAGLAWILNLDADLELAAVAYTPRESVREAVRAHVPIAAAALLDPGDVLVDESSAPGVAKGLVGRAFSPTPRAIAMLERAGAEPESHPPVSVLRRVSSRAFASAFPPTLPGAAFVTDLEEARAQIESTPPVGDGWRIKRAFGMTGRGQRIVAAGAAHAPELAFIGAGLVEGGVQIEPNVPIEREFALHGMLPRDGGLALGRVVVQRCDARGAWIETVPAEPAEARDVSSTLREEAGRVGLALRAAGYFGPFGIDAYTYRDREGARRLQPRSEINARYTMGFGVGFKGRARAGRP